MLCSIHKCLFGSIYINNQQPIERSTREGDSNEMSNRIERNKGDHDGTAEITSVRRSLMCTSFYYTYYYLYIYL